MRQKKRKRSGGYSLVEVVVAIAILGIIAVPIGTALTTAVRINTRADQTMRAQLAVSAVVERLMAEGYDGKNKYEYPGVTVEPIETSEPVNVKVYDSDELVVVETYIAPPSPSPTQKGGAS